MITTDAPAWLRRSDQAVTWDPHHAHRPPGVMKKVTGGLDDQRLDLLLFSWAVRECRAQAAAGEHGHGDERFGCVESVGAFGQCS